MKINYHLIYSILCFFILVVFTSCDEEWIPGEIQLNTGETSVIIEAIEASTGEPAANVQFTLYENKIGQEALELIFEGSTDTEGNLTIPDVDYPNILYVEVDDDNYPSFPEPKPFKVLGENSALINIELSKEWTHEHMYERNDWDVIAASSEQTEGLRQNILEANDAVWHSEYSPNSPDFPHWLIVDIKEEKIMHGFVFRNRANLNGAIKDVEVLISNDNENWESLTELTLALSTDWQLFTLPEEEITQARYIQLIFKSSHPGVPFANLAEFGVY